MKKYKPIIAAILALLLLAGGLYWYSYHVGVKEKIDRTVDAVAILEDGRELDCTVRFLGTLYVDHPSTEIDQFHATMTAASGSTTIWSSTPTPLSARMNTAL